MRAGLAAAAAMSLVACYQPSVRDCTVSCNSADDCAGDQVCANGMCAAPGNTCDVTVDAANPDAAFDDAPSTDGTMNDGTMTDGTPPIDAGADLRIVITGRGSVVGDQPGVNCTVPPADCTYGINPGTMVMLTAVDGPGTHTFIDWTTPNCMGAGRTCTVTVMAPVTLVGAAFN
jgi:hypothetical protein